MRIVQTSIPEVLILEPRVFQDERGFFLESYNEKVFRELTGAAVSFVQDNHSGSSNQVVRGLHYQIQQAQGKLVRVTRGKIFDVAVDLRRSSRTFGMAAACILSAENRRQFWIPPGFAHGFLTLEEWNEVQYKATDYYSPQNERSLLWNDPALAIEWPVADVQPTLTKKDELGKLLRDCETYA